jgi:hypothetical protein
LPECGRAPPIRRTAAVEEHIGSDEKSIRPVARKTGEGRIDFVARRGVERQNLEPNGGSGFLRGPQYGLDGRDISRIDKYGNANSLGHQVAEEPQPLRHHLYDEKIDPGCVAARLGEARD